MSNTLRLVLLLLSTAAVVVVPASDAHAQLRFERGQNVQPVFEGWERNADGTFTMVFGYLNRNYKEIPDVPVGANNSFEPGPADRGQPTRFYPRRQQFAFRVQVPADWGDKDLIWTMTIHGRTDQAIASLLPGWEIDDGVIKNNRGTGSSQYPRDNQHPSISIQEGTEFTVALPETLMLTVVVRDDGVPGPRPKPSEPTDPAALAARERRRAQASPINQAVVSARIAHETGLGMTWTHWRGPGVVTFDPMTSSIEGGRGGEVATTVSFTERGTIVLRGYADDTINTTPIDVTVTVN